MTTEWKTSLIRHNYFTLHKVFFHVGFRFNKAFSNRKSCLFERALNTIIKLFYCWHQYSHQVQPVPSSSYKERQTNLWHWSCERLIRQGFGCSKLENVQNYRVGDFQYGKMGIKKHSSWYILNIMTKCSILHSTITLMRRFLLSCKNFIEK